MENPVVKKSVLIWSSFILILFILLVIRYSSLDSTYFQISQSTNVSEYYSKLSSSCGKLSNVHKDLYSISTLFEKFPNITNSETEFQLRSSITEGWLETLNLNPNF